MMDNRLNYFNHKMHGAPVMSAAAGSVIGVLDACLITGFGLVPVVSLTVSGGVATATVDAGNAFEANRFVQIDGATPAALNGKFVVTAQTSTTFTFAAPAAPDGTASGTITAKYPPVDGWEKQYSGVNTAVYRSIADGSSRCCLRVDDSAAQHTKVVGYEQMSDVDTGIQPFPTASQRPSGSFWSHANANNTSAREWSILADSRYFLFAPSLFVPSASYPRQSRLLYGFGDLPPLDPSDVNWCTALTAGDKLTSGYGYLYIASRASDSFIATVFAKDVVGINSSIRAVHASILSGVSGLDNTLLPVNFLSSARASKYAVFPMYLADLDVGLRARVPALRYAPYASNNTRDVYDNMSNIHVVGRADGDFAIFPIATTSDYPYLGFFLLDLVTPWRT